MQLQSKDPALLTHPLDLQKNPPSLPGTLVQAEIRRHLSRDVLAGVGART
jgi:hypothetical protein